MPKRSRWEGMTCYTCEAPAVTGEDAPPKSCYPEGKRTGLYLVPSCDKHNHGKKLDDELIKATVVFANNGSPDGMEVLESVIRAMEYSPGLMKRFIPKPRFALVDGQPRPTYQVDRKRFDRSICYIARALWFKDTGEKLHAKLAVEWELFRLQSLAPNPNRVLEMARLLPENDYRGVYPEVFRYAFFTTPEIHGEILTLCRMRFYDGPPVCAFWFPT